VSGWLVVMHTYLCYFRLSMSHCRLIQCNKSNYEKTAHLSPRLGFCCWVSTFLMGLCQTPLFARVPLDDHVGLPYWTTCRQLGYFSKLLAAKKNWSGYFLNDLLPLWNIGRHEIGLRFSCCWRLFIENI